MHAYFKRKKPRLDRGLENLETVQGGAQSQFKKAAASRH